MLPIITSLVPLLTALLVAKSSGPIDTASLIASARQSLHRNDTDSAFKFLAEAYSENASTPGIMSCFEDVFRLKIKLYDNSVDRMGLASLLTDLGRYEEAANELRSLSWEEQKAPRALKEKATSMLFRTQAAICSWENYYEDGYDLAESVRSSIRSNTVPAVHPFEALMWPSITLQDASHIARLYAMEAVKASGRDSEPLPQQLTMRYRSVPFVKVSRHNPVNNNHRLKKIKIGYLSPDFTGKHPLAFLMQDVFRFHNASMFDIHIYSLHEADGSEEVEKIKNAAQKWTVLPTSDSQKIADIIRADGLDVLVDLCGYTGTSRVAEIMAHRAAPTQIGYMGFPSSTGAPFIDYMICDEVVVPPSYRKHYSESLIIMPHCYFVNSHKFLNINDDDDTSKNSRADYGLPQRGFVFCCHSRPDKIDPSTFRSWLRALKKVRTGGARDGIPEKENAVLWLLRSGDEMERNLRKLAVKEFGLSRESLIFAEKAPRDEHLRRLENADLFLDTPSYNAHTVGCDCLSAGVPMVSLLRPESEVNKESVATEKLSSRVGASLLQNVGLDELILPNMEEYETLLVTCASEPDWFSAITERLKRSRDTSPLFDTERWVRNLEAAFIDVVLNRERENTDIYVVDDA